MATTTVSPKFQVVIPKEVREKLRLAPKQRLQVLEKGGVITLIPEVPLKSLRGLLKGMSKANLREKKARGGKKVPGALALYKRLELLEAIIAGLRAGERGEVVSQARAMAELEKVLNG